jgi:hypothetical protein
VTYNVITAIKAVLINALIGILITVICSPNVLQLGVGIQGRAENIGHAINAALRSNPADTVVLSHDWANALNTIHRSDLFAAVTSRHPSLVPFANLMYGARTTVRFFSATATDTVDIVSARGVRQGDPLGPLLFALVLQRPLEAVAAAHPSVHPSLTPMTRT